MPRCRGRIAYGKAALAAEGAERGVQANGLQPAFAACSDAEEVRR